MLYCFGDLPHSLPPNAEYQKPSPQSYSLTRQVSISINTKANGHIHKETKIRKAMFF